MWSGVDTDSQVLDLDYLYNELSNLKENVKIPYIDRRAKNDDLNEDLLEEVKTAFSEIATKEKTLKQLIQVMEFVLDKYSNLSEDYDEATYKLTNTEDDNNYMRETVIPGLHDKLDRNEKRMEEMERQLFKAEGEVRELRTQLNNKKPETTVINNIEALEKRVRRQSLLDSTGKINGLEEAIKRYKDISTEME